MLPLLLSLLLLGLLLIRPLSFEILNSLDEFVALGGDGTETSPSFILLSVDFPKATVE